MATEIAAAVRDGSLSAGAAVRESLGRIKDRDAELGAFVRVREEAALAEAEAVDARADRAQLPLAGVPMAIKDNVPVAGEPMRLASLATPDVPQQADHPVVARLRAAGAVVVGLTTLPELGIFPFSDSAYGVARNPWEPSRTAGGSSGGSAAAVASGMVPVAHGNDGAGSIRIPAANCGLFGVKPGFGVVPAELGVDSWGGMAENGPLATTVADAALVLSVMAARPDLATVTDPQGVRVAVSVKPPSAGVLLARDHREAVAEAGRVLNGLGHTVVHADPAYPLWVGPALVAGWLAAPAADAELYDAARLEARTRRHIAVGRVAGRLRSARDDDRERLHAVFGPFFADHDVLLMPTLARPAPAAHRWERAWLRSFVSSVTYAPMTGVWNMAGYPAATVPMGLDASGRPRSAQLVAGPGKEDLLLGLAAQLERAHPWPRVAPR
jgi:amidase